MTVDLPQWIATAVLAALFCVFAAYNALIVWTRYIERAPAPSLAPIFGGLFGLGAVLSLPLGGIGERLWFSWIPLVLDVSIPITVLALWNDWRRG